MEALEAPGGGPRPLPKPSKASQGPFRVPENLATSPNQALPKRPGPVRNSRNPFPKGLAGSPRPKYWFSLRLKPRCQARLCLKTYLSGLDKSSLQTHIQSFKIGSNQSGHRLKKTKGLEPPPNPNWHPSGQVQLADPNPIFRDWKHPVRAPSEEN